MRRISQSLPLVAMAALSSSTDSNCSIAAAETCPERRIKRTKDGSVFVFEPATRSWRLETSHVIEPEAGVVPALPWAQFDVSFDGGFQIAGRPLLLSEGRGLRDQDEQQHADTGRSTWDGAVALAKALEQSPWLIHAKNVLELGAGRGVVSLSAARLGAKSIVATDLPYVLEDLQECARMNGCSVLDRSCEKNSNHDSLVEVVEFDWMNPSKFFDRRVAADRFDIVLGADVIWLMELVEPLVRALSAISDRNPDAEILIVHQRRASSVEEAFLAAMSDAGFVMQWSLQGSSVGVGARQATLEDRASWHPDFTPDDRMSLWAFRFRKPSQD